MMERNLVWPRFMGGKIYTNFRKDREINHRKDSANGQGFGVSYLGDGGDGNGLGLGHVRGYRDWIYKSSGNIHAAPQNIRGNGIGHGIHYLDMFGYGYKNGDGRSKNRN